MRLHENHLSPTLMRARGACAARYDPSPSPPVLLAPLRPCAPESRSPGTNAAAIRGALRAERPELLTVILPQSLSRQPAESQELLAQVGGQVGLEPKVESSFMLISPRFPDPNKNNKV